MSINSIDVTAIGNAIVDVLAQCDDEFLNENNITKSSMNLIDEERSKFLFDNINSPKVISGGSAANTAVGLASLGSTAAFIGKVKNDELGNTFKRDIEEVGVSFDTPLNENGPRTASSTILITPDAERSMNTFLGACVNLDAQDIDENLIKKSKLVYLEGYLFDAPNGPAIFAEAARLAHASRARIALSLSDPWCVERHRDALADFINDHVSVLLGNEDEIVSLCGTDCEVAAAQLVTRLEEVVVTRGPNGAMVLSGAALHHIAAMPQGPVVDTTGAGDLFAAGYLYGRTNGYELEASAHLASLSAGEVITHIGARPKTDLKKLATSIPKF